MNEPQMLSGRYRLGRALGHGGMGAVYEATDEVLGRAVAVKLMHVAQAPADAIERFRREARTLAGLSHPNIVTVYDFGVDADRAWLVMRLLPGPTLQTLIRNRGRLPVDSAVRYTRETASALAAAHAAGIVHRDVKPGNLMLGTDGSCTLVDLGIARLANSTETERGLTQPGMILGTVHYLAPEVITGGTPGPAADVYALGSVLFLMLTGSTPYVGADNVAALSQHVHAPVPSPATLRPETPPALAQLCTSMLAKQPGQRPSAATVATILAEGASVPTTARPAPRPAPAVPAATQMMAPPTGPALPPPAPPEDNEPSSRGWVIAALIAVAVIVGALAWLLLVGNRKSTGSPSTTAVSSPAASTSASSAAPSTSATAPSTSAAPSSPTAAPTYSPTFTPTTPTTPPTLPTSGSSGGSSTPSQLSSDLSQVHTAVGDAISGSQLSTTQSRRLVRSYDQLAYVTGTGDTSAIGNQLDDMSQLVDQMYGNGALTTADYQELTSAITTMQGDLGAG